MPDTLHAAAAAAAAAAVGARPPAPARLRLTHRPSARWKAWRQWCQVCRRPRGPRRPASPPPTRSTAAGRRRAAARGRWRRVSPLRPLLAPASPCGHCNCTPLSRDTIPPSWSALPSRPPSPPQLPRPLPAPAALPRRGAGGRGHVARAGARLRAAGDRALAAVRAPRCTATFKPLEAPSA